MELKCKPGSGQSTIGVLSCSKGSGQGVTALLLDFEEDVALSLPLLLGGLGNRLLSIPRLSLAESAAAFAEGGNLIDSVESDEDSKVICGSADFFFR